MNGSDWNSFSFSEKEEEKIWGELEEDEKAIYRFNKMFVEEKRSRDSHDKKTVLDPIVNLLAYLRSEDGSFFNEFVSLLTIFSFSYTSKKDMDTLSDTLRSDKSSSKLNVCLRSLIYQS
jgi:hypothetical protein